MKTLAILVISLFSMASFGQSESRDEIVIDKTQQDDTYRAGENININAVILGDLVVAGGNLIVNDSIIGDLTAAGGELFLNNYVADDVRIAVGRVTIGSEIGDDLVVFGGEVILTENAIIHGDLKCFAGKIEIYGDVNGSLEVKGADVVIDGTIKGSSKLIGEDISIGANAKFYKGVEYWNSGGEIDFKNSLVNSKAQFNEDLGAQESDLSLTTFGTTTFSLWIFYVLSAFLVILVVHALFRNTFSFAVEGLENNWLKSFGLGLIYLIGIPLLIIIALLLIIGIPLGLFAMVIFLFSLLFGHLIASLLLVHYINYKKGMNWGFWSITFLALLCAVTLRALTIIPFAGIIVSVIVLAITYGALTLRAIHSKKQLVKK